MVPLEAIIVTFVNRIDRRTNIVHLSIKGKNWNRHLGLPSAKRRCCVLERYPRIGCTNATYLPSKGFISTLLVIQLLWHIQPRAGGSSCFLCSTMSGHNGGIDRGWAAFSNGCNYLVLPHRYQAHPLNNNFRVLLTPNSESRQISLLRLRRTQVIVKT